MRWGRTVPIASYPSQHRDRDFEIEEELVDERKFAGGAVINAQKVAGVRGHVPLELFRRVQVCGTKTLLSSIAQGTEDLE